MSANVTTISGGTSQFKYGDLIANIIDFVIVALIVFIAYKILKRHKLIEDKTEPESK
jgi:large conductance mechanosensitive channel